ncbi:MAG: SUMF1/EgtB/PvdO family nonheme iron enzyme [Phormidesmis sp.]
MSRIFISYRRDDSAAEAGRIYDYLERTFGEDSVFKDVDNIDAGDDFRERLNEAVGQCQVLLAVIGQDWLTIKDGAGQRRLDNPADWVRLEIETALKRKIRVIPVLLDGVAMPRMGMLPESLQALAYRNAAFIRHDPDFRKDIKYVIGVIQRHFARLEQPAPVPDDVPKSNPQPVPVAQPVPKPLVVQKEEHSAWKKQPVPVQPKVASPKKPRLDFEVVTVNSKGEVTQREKHGAEYYQEDLGGGITLDLMRIPSGDFVMGSPEGEGFKDEKPQHKVSVPEFWMGRYPVTQAQWKSVAALPKVNIALKSDPSKFKGDNRPVEQVNWYEAREFCNRLAQCTGVRYRLPSESEWEYACRAGTTTPFYFGETLTAEIANYRAKNTYASEPKGAYREETTEAGIFSANAYGLYDMHGNVWEWCLDCWHDRYSALFRKAPEDGSAWIKGGKSDRRVVRGGSWYYLPWYCRSAFRGNLSPELRYYDIGFRVSCAAPRILE